MIFLVGDTNPPNWDFLLSLSCLSIFSCLMSWVRQAVNDVGSYYEKEESLRVAVF